MEIVRLGSLELGSLRLEGVDAASRDYNTGSPLPPIDGILCLDAFRGMVITLDYPARRVRIERGQLPEPDGNTILAAEAGRRNLVVHLQVGGRVVPATIDTGNVVGLLLPASVVSELPKVGEAKAAGKARSVSGEFDIMQAELAEPVRLGAHSLGTTVRYHPFAPIGNVGSRELANLRASFDAANLRVRLESSAGGAPTLRVATDTAAPEPLPQRREIQGAPPQRRYGIAFAGLGATTVDVVSAEAGSIAERGGVQAGDRVLKMNGKLVGELSEEARIAALRGSPLVLQIERAGRTLEIRLALDGPAAGAPAPAANTSAHPNAGRVKPPAGATIIPIEFSRNVPVVNVEINGKGPFRLFFDTGAQGSVLDEKLIEELGIPVLGEASVTSPGGQPVAAKRVRLESVKLGNFTRTSIPAISLDRSRLGNDPATPRGVLSANAFMEGSTITISYPDRQVWIAPGELPEPDGREIFTYDAGARLPEVTLRVAEKDFTVHLDSGAPSSITLPLVRAKELPLESVPVEVARGRRVDREVILYGAKLRGTVQLGRYTFENPDLRFDGSIETGGTVGFGVLKDFVVTLDKKNRRIRLQQ